MICEGSRKGSRNYLDLATSKAFSGTSKIFGNLAQIFLRPAPAGVLAPKAPNLKVNFAEGEILSQLFATRTSGAPALRRRGSSLLVVLISILFKESVLWTGRRIVPFGKMYNRGVWQKFWKRYNRYEISNRTIRFRKPTCRSPGWFFNSIRTVFCCNFGDAPPYVLDYRKWCSYTF